MIVEHHTTTLICAECRVRMRVVKTIREGASVTIRYWRCEECGQTGKTVEEHPVSCAGGHAMREWRRH